MSREDAGVPICGKPPRHSPRSRAYSPGGCGCALIMLPVMAVGAGAALALTSAAVAAVICLAAALGATIYFAATASRRREQGRRLGGWIAVPIILYALSIPYLVFFWLIMSQ